MSIKPQSIMLLAGWLLAAPAMALTATNAEAAATPICLSTMMSMMNISSPPAPLPALHRSQRLDKI
jgi:hypothetical protein